MKIQGKITDSRTGEALPGVDIFSVDANFAPLGDGTTADENGNYVFDSTNLDGAGNYAGFSSAGYKPTYIIPSAGTLNIALDESGALDEVVITAKRTVKKAADHVKANKTVYYIAGFVLLAGIGFYLYKRFKKSA